MKTAKTHSAAIRKILAALGFAESGSIQAQLAAAEIEAVESESLMATVYSHRGTAAKVAVNW